MPLYQSKRHGSLSKKLLTRKTTNEWIWKLLIFCFSSGGRSNL